MPEGTCVVDGCPREAIKSQLCGAHYQRKRIYGDVRAHIPIQDNGIKGITRRVDGKCRNGHPVDPGKDCRECGREKRTEYKRAKRAAEKAARPAPLPPEVRHMAALRTRLYDRLVVSDETWNGTPHVLWTGANVRGYGVIWNALAGNNRYVHRMAWEAVNGPIPDDLTIDHLCRTTLCAAVDHLEPVTISENVRRADPGGKQRDKTHCIRGHERNDENTRRDPKTGGRQCKVCQRDYARERYRAKAAKKASAVG